LKRKEKEKEKEFLGNSTCCFAVPWSYHTRRKKKIGERILKLL
jgi:hypothetical protein